jgi:hypothetical protein
MGNNELQRSDGLWVLAAWEMRCWSWHHVPWSFRAQPCIGGKALKLEWTRTEYFSLGEPRCSLEPSSLQKTRSKDSSHLA